MKTFKSILSEAWDLEGFYNIRNGIFNEDQFELLKKDFIEYAPNEIGLDDREVITMTWFIPTFISWQEERLLEKGVSEEDYNVIYNFFWNQCERLLGLP